MTTHYATMQIQRTYQSEWRGSVQDNDVEMTVQIQGDWVKAKESTLLDPPQGGLYEDIIATLDGEEIELTERELSEAADILMERGSRFEPVIVKGNVEMSNPLIDECPSDVMQATAYLLGVTTLYEHNVQHPGDSPAYLYVKLLSHVLSMQRRPPEDASTEPAPATLRPEGEERKAG